MVFKISSSIRMGIRGIIAEIFFALVLLAAGVCIAGITQWLALR